MDITKVKWRPYQEEIFDVVKKKKDEGVTRQLIVSATGTGKRLIAVHISKDYKKTLFLCHTEELIEQAREDYAKMFPFDVGIIKAKRFEIDKRIVIASAQTMWRRLDKIDKNEFDLVIADECHHYLAKKFVKPLDYFEFDLMLGFTATPTRLDGLNFSNIVDEIVYDYSIDKAIKEGFLCELKAKRIRTEIDISSVKKVGGDFNKKELDNRVNIPERNRLIVRKYIEYGQGRQGVVYCASIAHAHAVKEEFDKNGISCEVLSSKTDPDERKKINKLFKKGGIKVLTNVNILTEGWDYSDVGLIMMARPTQSLALYMQMIGRGTRLKSKKFIDKYGENNCGVLDFVDNCGNHKLINTWTLERGKRIEERVFLSEKQKQVLIARRDEERLEREATIKRLYKTDKDIDLLALPKIIVHHKGRMLEPATEKQLKWIKDLGYWQPGVEYTKAQASELISSAPAYPWMIRKLIEWKYDIIDQEPTIGQYGEAKRLMEQNDEEQAINNKDISSGSPFGFGNAKKPNPELQRYFKNWM